MVKVYAPASIGNIGVGFDLLGIAIVPIDGDFLGDCVNIKSSKMFNLECTGCFREQLPKKLEENVVFQCWQKFCAILGEMCSVDIRLEKNVPVASGLGSSACSIVAALTAMNYYFGNPLNNNQLLQLMGEIEGNFSGAIHFDNVSPCFFGGMQLLVQERNNFSQRVPIFDNWFWVVAYPGIKISTEIARSVLPKKYCLEDCISYGRFLSGFIHACHTQQESLAISCIKDVIAEPYRSQLLPIPITDIRRVLIKKGAVSCGISGSGPTIFALCNNKDVANFVSLWLSTHYLQSNMGFVRICRIDDSGVRIIMDEQ